MAYTTRELVTNAFYLANIVSRDFETPTGAQITNGVSIVNDLLADKTANSSMIPYSTQYTTTAIAGTAEYFIPNLIYAETFTFSKDNVRYQTTYQGRKKFFGSFRVTDVQSLPFNYHFERKLGGSTLYLYFIPDENYPLEIWGEFALASVTIDQDLELTLDRFYINYMKYETAVRMCLEYGYMVPQAVQNQLDEYYRWINARTNTMDLSQGKLSTLQNQQGINWAWVNLARGWTA